MPNLPLRPHGAGAFWCALVYHLAPYPIGKPLSNNHANQSANHTYVILNCGDLGSESGNQGAKTAGRLAIKMAIKLAIKVVIKVQFL